MALWWSATEQNDLLCFYGDKHASLPTGAKGMDENEKKKGTGQRWYRVCVLDEFAEGLVLSLLPWWWSASAQEGQEKDGFVPKAIYEHVIWAQARGCLTLKNVWKAWEKWCNNKNNKKVGPTDDKSVIVWYSLKYISIKFMWSSNLFYTQRAEARFFLLFHSNSHPAASWSPSYRNDQPGNAVLPLRHMKPDDCAAPAPSPVYHHK